MTKLFCVKIGRLRLNLLLFPAVFFAIYLEYFPLFLISFLSVLLHECAHIVAAALLGVGVWGIEISPFGVCALLESEGINNSEKEFAIAFCGPFFSLILGLCAYIAPIWEREYIFFMNICICAVNLIPVLPLDGGRMLRSMLTYKMGILRAYNVSVRVSKALTVLLWIFSIWILIKTKMNFTYVLIAAFLMGNIKTEQKNITISLLREILENPKKIQSIKRTKTYTVREDERAQKILRYISYDYYITVNIAKDGEIIAALTEEQILKGILREGISASFGELIPI